VALSDLHLFLALGGECIVIELPRYEVLPVLGVGCEGRIVWEEIVWEVPIDVEDLDGVDYYALVEAYRMIENRSTFHGFWRWG
jgi:hypothetical protein